MAILSKDKIWINDVSSDTVQLYVDTPPLPPKAEKITQDVTIPGRDESLVFTENMYSDIQIDLSTYIFDNDTDMSFIYKWLDGAETLRTTQSDFYYYKIKKVLGVIPNYLGHGKTNIILSFLCSPFKYKVDNTIQSAAKSFTVTNSGGYYCRPVYKITGSGTITLAVNNDSNKITVYDVSGECVIDSERMLVYDSSGNLLRTSGKIPFCVIGENRVEITGNVTKSEITMNERWM